MKREEYETPEMEVVIFEKNEIMTDDIITGSNELPPVRLIN